MGAIVNASVIHNKTKFSLKFSFLLCLSLLCEEKLVIFYTINLMPCNTKCTFEPLQKQRKYAKYSPVKMSHQIIILFITNSYCQQCKYAYIIKYTNILFKMMHNSDHYSTYYSTDRHADW